MRTLPQGLFQRSSPLPIRPAAALLAVLAATLFVPVAPAQTLLNTSFGDAHILPAQRTALPVEPASDSLPDAPGSISSSVSSSAPNSTSSSVTGSAANAGGRYTAASEFQIASLPNPLHPSHRTPSPTDIVVRAGDVAPRQTPRDKLVGSLRDSVSPYSLFGELISGSYAQLRNGTPNYGDDASAFPQRFGAAVARGTSQKLFNEGALAAILREDPRYYQLGKGHSILKRVAYAGTRPLITRTDSGKSTPNFALLGGYLGAAALTKVYYPPLNQGFDQTLQTYGGSIGGAALGSVVTEFLSDALEFVHLQKKN